MKGIGHFLTLPRASGGLWSQCLCSLFTVSMYNLRQKEGAAPSSSKKMAVQVFAHSPTGPG